MSFYEINLLLSAKISAEEANSQIGDLEAFLQKSGKLASERKIEMKKLAYPILGQEEAWFSFITLYPNLGIVKKDMLKDLEKMIKENKNIIRHLILKKEKIKIKRSDRRMAAKAEQKEKKIEEQQAPADEQEKSKVELEQVEEKLNEMLGE